jgi:hypothetical protein
VYCDKGKNVGYMNESFSITIRSLKDLELRATADGYYRIGQGESAPDSPDNFRAIKAGELWRADDVFYPKY